MANDTVTTVTLMDRITSGQNMQNAEQDKINLCGRNSSLGG